MKYRKLILILLDANECLKSVDLALKVMEYINPQVFKHQEYMDALEDLLLDGEIIELPFTTPETINGKVGSKLNGLYFPKGTRFCVAFLHGNLNQGSRI